MMTAICGCGDMRSEKCRQDGTIQLREVGAEMADDRPRKACSKGARQAVLARRRG